MIGGEATFAEQLQRNSRDRPDQTAVIYTTDPYSNAADHRLTHRQLRDDATALAGRLRHDHPSGSRLLLVHPPGPDFVVAFVACQFAGVVAVPAPEPDQQRHRRRRLVGIIESSGAVAVLTDAASMDEVRAWSTAASVDLPVIATDREAARGGGGQLRGGPAPDPESLALLQYTSGSTAAPRGTMISQRNLASHSRMFLAMLDTGGPVAMGGWLPTFHDMGLVGHVITPLFGGGTSVLMPPTSFLRRPANWLRLVDRYGLYMSAGPSFAYEMCTARVSDEELRGLDLSRWAVAINGSEPVRARSVAAFTDRFAAAGLRAETVCPGYGLAEATLAVSVSRRREPPTITPVRADMIARHVMRPLDGAAPDPTTFGPELVGNGPAGPEVRIVDPVTRAVLTDHEVGEIWVRGPSVAEGYWSDEEATRETFAATTGDGEPGFLRTGDLGTFHDGELYVTGRIKEVLVVSGRTLYPQDVEAEARLCDSSLVGLVGAAFTIPVPQEEAVLVHEFRPGQGAADDPRRLVESLRLALSRAFGIAVNVVLVEPRTVPRTTSGKVQRGLIRARLLAGEVVPVAAGLTIPARTALAGSPRSVTAVLPQPTGGQLA
jgi:acyl-CoA synthetase (AMP-forming)/AMP-acid ligase II